MTHNSQCIQADTVILTGRHSHPHSCCCFYVHPSKVNHTPLPLLTYSQIPTFLHTLLSINQVTHSHTHTDMHSHKHSHTVLHADSHRHTQLQTPWGHTSSPIVRKCCWFSLICRLCVCQSLWLPSPSSPLSLSLSAPRQVSASIFSSSVAVKLNGIGLIAENQREGW